MDLLPASNAVVGKPVASPAIRRSTGGGSGLERIAEAVREVAVRQARLQEAVACAGSESHDKLLQVCRSLGAPITIGHSVRRRVRIS